MAFCTQCGAAVADGARFCTSCGAKMAAPAPQSTPKPEFTATQQEYAAPQTYEAPKQEYTAPQSYAAPQQQYTAPQSYEVPKQEYTAPQSYAAPQQEYSAPMSYAAPAAAPKKKSKTGLIIGLAAGAVVILAVVLVLLLGGKGGKSGGASSDPMVGTWNAVSAEMLGYDMDIADVYPDGFSLELKSGGKCGIHVSGSNGNGKWTYDNDNVFTLSGSGLDCTGYVLNGQLVLENLMDSGINLYFDKEGGAPDVGVYDNGADTADSNDGDAVGSAASETPLQQWWSGDWYGWWSVSSCSGNYEDWEDMWWDVCAHMDVAADGTAFLTIWDEDFSKDDPLAEISFTISEASGAGTMGAATSESGYFMDMAVSHADFIVDPSLFDYDNMMGLDGWYEVENGSYYLDMYLRPWGQLWDDVAADNANGLPYYYDSWYLPAIQAGAAMPDTVNGTYTAGSASSGSASSGSAASASVGGNTYNYAGWDCVYLTYPDSYAPETDSILETLESADGTCRVEMVGNAGSGNEDDIQALTDGYSSYDQFSSGTMTVAGYDAWYCSYYDDFFEEYGTIVVVDFGGKTATGTYGMTFYCYSTNSVEDSLNADILSILNSMTVVLE